MKNKLFKIITSISLTALVTTSTILPPTITYADNNLLMGVPIEQFNKVNDAKAKLENTLTEHGDLNSNEFQLKYMFDMYDYAYSITFTDEQIGNNETDILLDHVRFYNSNIDMPITASDKIESTGSGSTFKITTASSVYKNKLTALAGKSTDTKDIVTLWGTLKKVRADLGFQEQMSESDTWDNSTLSEGQLYAKIRENIVEIRLLLSMGKEYLIDYENNLANNDYQALYKYYVNTYNLIISFSADNNVQALTGLDLFGDITNEVFNINLANAHKHVGEWEDGEQILTKYSEYMLKNIAASSTFRPFETNLNGTGAFNYLGNQNVIFHENYGIFRKMLLTPTTEFNTLSSGIDIENQKKLKYMTLREFTKNDNTPRILYVDNIEYTTAQIKDIQNNTTENNNEREETGNESADAVLEDMATDENPTGWEKVNKWIDNNTVILSGVKWLFSDPLCKGQSGKEHFIREVAFASGDINMFSTVSKKVNEKAYDINLSQLIYKNIMEEYFWSSKLQSWKFNQDMDRPIYIDIYGNILTASGYVIIPAVANPWLYKDDEGMMLMNLAFIESYPQYTLSNGVLSVNKKDENKLALKFENTSEVDDLTERNPKEYKSVIHRNDLGELPENKLEDLKVIVDTAELSEGGMFSFSLANGKSNSAGTLNPIANKFSDDFEAVKGLDVFTFPTSAEVPLVTYDNLKKSLEKTPENQSVLLVNEYNVSVGGSAESASGSVSFLKVPDNKELKRFLYIVNLEKIAKIEDGKIVDKQILDPKHTHVISSEVYTRGIRDVTLLNTLVPEFVKNGYEELVDLLLNMSNNRYEKALGDSVNNNLLYNQDIEEVDMFKSVLPVIYKIILFIAITSIIINIILLAIKPENRLKNLTKVFVVVYLVTFLFTGSGFLLDNLVNKPLRSLFSGETTYWALIEQVKDKQKGELHSEDNLEKFDNYDGSSIVLTEIPYQSPFNIFNSKNSGAITIDEYYENYLIGEGVFKVKNDSIYMDGNKMMVDLNTVYSSSTISHRDDNNVLKPLEHSIVSNPELAYYMPYYMFIDNIVFNLNGINNLYAKVPYEIAYINGDKTTTGRINSLLNSALFLDYDDFIRRVNEYEHSESISEELAVANIKDVIEKYGNQDDFLGLRKILGVGKDVSTLPFSEEGLERIKNTGWFPELEIMNEHQLAEINHKALKVNDKTKKFMMSLADVSDEISDEQLIKTIALYASFEFNKEFQRFAPNKGPKSVELKDVPIETILMSTSVERDRLLKSSIQSYPNHIVDEQGYFGLMVSSVNDLFILFLNYVKPFIMVLVWVLAGVMIFTKKIILPDTNNNSIVGSIKLMLFYIISSLSYGFAVYGVILLTNSSFHPLATQLLFLVCNIVYAYLLVYMIFAILSDTKNLGASVIFKGAEQTIRNFGSTVSGMVKSSALGSKFFGRYADNLEGRTKHLSQYMEQKSVKYSNDIGSTSIKQPINFTNSLAKTGVQGIRKGADVAKTATANTVGRAMDVTKKVGGTAVNAVSGVEIIDTNTTSKSNNNTTQTTNINNDNSSRSGERRNTVIVDTTSKPSSSTSPKQPVNSGDSYLK